MTEREPRNHGLGWLSIASTILNQIAEEVEELKECATDAVARENRARAAWIDTLERAQEAETEQDALREQADKYRLQLADTLNRLSAVENERDEWRAKYKQANE